MTTSHRARLLGEDLPAVPLPHLADAGFGTAAYDRVLERRQLAHAGARLAEWRVAATRRDLVAVLPALLREGRGCRIRPRLHRVAARARHARDEAAAIAAWEAMGRIPCLVEAALPVARVLVVQLTAGVARAPGGQVAERDIAGDAWHPVRDAAMDLGARRAARLARDLARRLPDEAPLALELFLLDDGGLVVDAMAWDGHPAFATGSDAAHVATTGAMIW